MTHGSHKQVAVAERCCECARALHGHERRLHARLSGLCCKRATYGSACAGATLVGCGARRVPPSPRIQRRTPSLLQPRSRLMRRLLWCCNTVRVAACASPRRASVAATAQRVATCSSAARFVREAHGPAQAASYHVLAALRPSCRLLSLRRATPWRHACGFRWSL